MTDRDRAGIVPPEAAVPVDGRHVEQVDRRVHATLLAAQAFVEFEGTSFLEQVDDRVRVGSERHRHAGRGEGAGRADAVAEVAFGGRAHRHGRTGRGERGDVGVVEVGGVHRGEPLRRALRHPRAPRSVFDRDARGTPRSRPAAPTRGHGAPRRCRRPSAPTVPIASGSTARTEWMAAPIRRVSVAPRAATRSIHASTRAIAEPALRDRSAPRTPRR